MKNYTSRKVLIIADDKSFLKALKRFLEIKNFKVEIAEESQKGYKYILKKQYDLLIVDLRSTLEDKITILQKIRDRGILSPVISISDQYNLEDEINSFKYGANLFHRRPIHYSLLEAQIYSLLKLDQKETVILKDIKIDFDSKAVFKKGESLNLTRTEFNVLTLLVKAQGRLFTREDILRRAFDNYKDIQNNSVDTLISRLRKKIGDLDSDNLVETVFKTGYRINSKYINN